MWVMYHFHVGPCRKIRILRAHFVAVDSSVVTIVTCYGHCLDALSTSTSTPGNIKKNMQTFLCCEVHDQIAKYHEQLVGSKGTVLQYQTSPVFLVFFFMGTKLLELCLLEACILFRESPVCEMSHFELDSMTNPSRLHDDSWPRLTEGSKKDGSPHCMMQVWNWSPCGVDSVFNFHIVLQGRLAHHFCAAHFPWHS